MKQSCLFQRFASDDINEMKFDDVIRDFEGPKVWSFNAFWSILIIIERKTSSLLATRSNLVLIIFFSYKFCAGDFSNMRRPIFVKEEGTLSI